ncbi:sensor domain-containing diguanylate cyclase [Saccharothrix australiensis]|uniref:Diguanylate cyclase (GGDEF)-like protein n=1 Tax=Saccharothrix australiensis TaxID=2072 RepID=A0A495VR67_9PSEU|nr:GGDEF domain-containing protein [Saccharothrix australiensis]RKT51782.1 diguanylate cyclase (GGDEF)-like protein [Saccharothrix australiensis]
MSTAQTTASRAVWDELVSALPVGVLLQDASGAVLAGNRLAASLMGVPCAELRGFRRPAAWDASGAPLPSCAELSSQVLRTGAPLTIPMVLPHARLWAEYHPLEPRQQVLVVLRPVQSDVPHSARLLDGLTGLPGRALLLDRLDQALTRARTHGTLASLVLADVHRMAAVNRAHGFQRGDELLTAIAGRLRQGLRDDYTVARYGGDEFAVVAEHPNGSGEAVAARVRELAGRSVRIGGVRLRPGVRVCWVTSDGDAAVHSVLAHVEERLRHTGPRTPA